MRFEFYLNGVHLNKSYFQKRLVIGENVLCGNNNTFYNNTFK